MAVESLNLGNVKPFCCKNFGEPEDLAIQFIHNHRSQKGGPTVRTFFPTLSRRLFPLDAIHLKLLASPRHHLRTRCTALQSCCLIGHSSIQKGLGFVSLVYFLLQNETAESGWLVGRLYGGG
ncbi:hypothetical protein BV898_00879 [Hypsibius exemplaris]|uniref:Uncharacterized protein n=1 Tax=Hypsibius exemplaris TaxID=2072580 RepID=A0A1W0XCL3_HYPEX|nr:hypothetical protein BV898_00879 [Hypsibius exemplaris]